MSRQDLQEIAEYMRKRAVSDRKILLHIKEMLDGCDNEVSTLITIKKLVDTHLIPGPKGEAKS